MNTLTPFLKSGEAAKTARMFLKDHKSVFWSILKPLLPYIIGLHAVDVALHMTPRGSQILPPQYANALGIGALLSSYFYAALIISWYRAILNGPEHFTPMNPLKPTKNELKFIGVWILAAIAMVFAAAIIIGLFTTLGGKAGMVAGALIAVFTGIYFFLKISFIFPALALNTPISFQQSFTLTHGYLLRLLIAPIKASWRVYLAIMLYQFVAAVLIAVIQKTNPEQIDSFITAKMIMLPVTLYFQPLLLALSIGVIAVYYRHAMQYEQLDRPHSP
ncbi:MAG: hypothetical protein IT559_03555 [Alphaproteobacteria bacterium]|nr:hypothetical protein [Alphaproteobacteria bacterium]